MLHSKNNFSGERANTVMESNRSTVSEHFVYFVNVSSWTFSHVSPQSQPPLMMMNLPQLFMTFSHSFAIPYHLAIATSKCQIVEILLPHLCTHTKRFFSYPSRSYLRRCCLVEPHRANVRIQPLLDLLITKVGFDITFNFERWF